MQTVDYEAQAEKFLSDTFTTICWRHLGRFHRFEETKLPPPNVFEFTIARVGHKETYSGQFSSSVASTYFLKDKNWPHDPPRPCPVKYPSAYNLLACLEKNDVGTFENFCGEFGYDTDSRKALDTYLAVSKEASAIRRLFGDVLDRLQEIQ